MPFGSQEWFLAYYPQQMSFPLKGQTHFLFLDYVIAPVLDLKAERYNNRPLKTMQEALLSQLLLIKQPKMLNSSHWVVTHTLWSSATDCWIKYEGRGVEGRNERGGEREIRGDGAKSLYLNSRGVTCEHPAAERNPWPRRATVTTST